MSATRYLLLRHGQIAANKAGRWHGSTDSKLTWHGRRQAKRTGLHLASNERIDAIYSSPLRRCMDTAQETASRLDIPVVPLEGLQEMSIGEWEDMSFRQLADEHDFVNRASQDPTFAPPRGESLSMVAERVTAAVETIDARHPQDTTVLVVSHGVALAVALAQLMDGSPALWTNYHFDNCSLTEFYLSPEPYVESFNRSAHL